MWDVYPIQPELRKPWPGIFCTYCYDVSTLNIYIHSNRITCHCISYIGQGREIREHVVLAVKCPYSSSLIGYDRRLRHQLFIREQLSTSTHGHLEAPDDVPEVSAQD